MPALSSSAPLPARPRKRKRKGKDESRIRNRKSVRECRERKKRRVESLEQEETAAKKEHPILRELIQDCASLMEECFEQGLLSRTNYPNFPGFAKSTQDKSD